MVSWMRREPFVIASTAIEDHPNSDGNVVFPKHYNGPGAHDNDIGERQPNAYRKCVVEQRKLLSRGHVTEQRWRFTECSGRLTGPGKRHDYCDLYARCGKFFDIQQRVGDQFSDGD